MDCCQSIPLEAGKTEVLDHARSSSVWWTVYWSTAAHHMQISFSLIWQIKLNSITKMAPCRKSWPGNSEGKVEIFLSVRRIALQLSEHMRGKGNGDKTKGRETRGREGWEEIEDTSWVQFRDFPQEMEWPVSATIEVMQFLVDTSVFREYRGPLLWCAHPEEKAKGPHSTKDPPWMTWPVDSYYGRLTTPQPCNWHFTVSCNTSNRQDYQAGWKLLWSQPSKESPAIPHPPAFYSQQPNVQKKRCILIGEM